MKNNKLIKSLGSIICLVLVLMLLNVTPSSAAFYKGKAIEVIVPYSAGGGTDVFVRFMSAWLTKYIPGNPSIVVRNMPGASGMIGANHAYNVAKKDGLTMMAGSGGINLHSLLQFEGVKFNLNNMPMVLATSSGIIHYCKADLFSKFEDLYEKELLIYGHLPPGSSQTTCFILIKELLGVKAKKLLLAYGGSGDARRAFLRGEINATSDTVLGYMGRSIKLEKRGEIKILWQTGILDLAGNIVRVDPPLGHVPTVFERYKDRYGKPPGGKIWDAYKALVAAVIVFDKSLVFPPGTPEKFVGIVAKACEKMVKDPEFSAAAGKKLKVPIVAGERLRQLYDKNMIGADPEAINWLKTWLREKWGRK